MSSYVTANEIFVVLRIISAESIQLLIIISPCLQELGRK